MQAASKTIARNAIYLMGVELGTKVLELGLSILVANVLGRKDFGLLNAAYALAGIVALLPGFGMDVLVVRDVAGNPRRGPAYLVHGALISSVLSVPAYTGLWLFAAYKGSAPAETWIILLVGAVVFVDGAMVFVNSFFRAFQVMQFEVLVRGVVSLATVAAGVIVLFTGLGLKELVLSRLVIHGCGLFFAGTVLLSRGLVLPRARCSLAEVRRIVSRGWRLAVLSFFITVFVSVDLVMLYAIHGKEAVGIYAAATKFLAIVLLLPKGIVDAVLPAMARRASQGGTGFTAITAASHRYLLALALPIAMFLAWYAPFCITTLFRQGGYEEAAQVLAILAWSLVFDFLNHAGNRALISLEQERLVLFIVVAAAAANITSNLFAIPRYGAAGAAFTTVATEMLVFVLQTSVLWRKGVRLPLASVFLRPAVAGAVLALVLGTGVFSHPLSIPLLLSGYVAALFAGKGLSFAEVAVLWEGFRLAWPGGRPAPGDEASGGEDEKGTR